MEENKLRSVCTEAIRRYGPENQMGIAQEECAELIQAISKCRRYGIGGKHLDNLIEEIADVTICLEQLKIILEQNGVSKTRREIVEDVKLVRLEQKMGGE